MRCGRCTTTRCADHMLGATQRCERCEQDWRAETATRRAAKLMFAPPIGVLAGGMVFLVLLPVTFFGALGAALMCTLACATAIGAGTGTCRLIDHSARAMFLRERAGALPQARLLLRHRH
jgi:hypothetical protein